MAQCSSNEPEHGKETCLEDIAIALLTCGYEGSNPNILNTPCNDTCTVHVLYRFTKVQLEPPVPRSQLSHHTKAKIKARHEESLAKRTLAQAKRVSVKGYDF